MNETTKTTKAPRGAPLSLAHKLVIGDAVKTCDASTPDAALAEELSKKIGRQVTQQVVAYYRKQLGLESVRKPRPATMAAYIETLQGLLRAASIEVPAMPVEVNRDDPVA